MQNQQARLDESYERYAHERAQEKYESNKQFKKATDYLAGLLEKSNFDSEDLADIVRAATGKQN